MTTAKKKRWMANRALKAKWLEAYHDARALARLRGTTMPQDHHFKEFVLHMEAHGTVEAFLESLHHDAESMTAWVQRQRGKPSTLTVNFGHGMPILPASQVIKFSTI
jgi:hypothetical protein